MAKGTENTCFQGHEKLTVSFIPRDKYGETMP